LGRIIASNDDSVTLSFDGKEVTIQLSNIDKARLKPEF
jgi:ribosome maturation factor RimP